MQLEVAPFPTMFSTKSDDYPHLSIFLTAYLYLALNWESKKLAYQVSIPAPGN